MYDPEEPPRPFKNWELMGFWFWHLVCGPLVFLTSVERFVGEELAMQHAIRRQRRERRLFLRRLSRHHF